MHPLIFGLIIALPFYVIRVGGYTMWRFSDEDQDTRKTWSTFNQMKPRKYWMDPLVFWTFQSIWILACLFPFFLIMGG